MKVRADIRESHHNGVITAASRLLRQKGVDGLSIGTLMRGEGLTHGGFYRHFKSKNELIEAAVREMFGPFIREITQNSGNAGAPQAVRRYIDHYLSMDHVKHPELGCPVAAFAAETARLGRSARKAFAAGLGNLKDALVPGLNPATHQTADALLALLAGAVIMARAAPDDEKADTILQAAKHHAQGFLG